VSHDRGKRPGQLGSLRGFPPFLSEEMRNTIVIIAWSLVLAIAYSRAPQLTPHNPRLFRLGVRCLSLVLPAVSFIRLIPAELPADVAAIVVGVLVGCGTFLGLVCMGFAWILDAQRRDP
jgi:hypothetical protein